MQLYTCVHMCAHMHVCVRSCMYMCAGQGCASREGIKVREKERGKYIPNIYQHFQNNFPATIFFSSSKSAIIYVNWLFIYVIIYSYHIYDYMHAYTHLDSLTYVNWHVNGK